MPESLEQLDLLLVNVARSRMVQRDGVHFSGYRYVDPTLGAYVGEKVTVRYDPRDMAEIRLFHHGVFLCRAITPELAGATISLRDIVSARKQQRGVLRQEVARRQRTVKELLAFRGGPGEDREASNPEPVEHDSKQVTAHISLKRYRHE